MFFKFVSGSISIILSICLFLLYFTIKGNSNCGFLKCQASAIFSEGAFMFHWLIRLSVIFSSLLIGGFGPHALSSEKRNTSSCVYC